MSTRLHICGCRGGQRGAKGAELPSPTFSTPATPIPGEKRLREVPGAVHSLPLYAAPRPLQGSCWCFTLRQGSLAVAVFFAIIAVFSFAVAIVHPAENEFKGNRQNTLKASYDLFGIVAALKIIFSFMLLAGIMREQTQLMKPWLISYFVVCPVEACMLLTGSFVAMLFGVWTIALTILAGTVLYIICYGFCLRVIYTYYTSVSEVIDVII